MFAPTVLRILKRQPRVCSYLSNANIELDGKTPLERVLDWQMDQARQAEETFARELLAGKQTSS